MFNFTQLPLNDLRHLNIYWFLCSLCNRKDHRYSKIIIMNHGEKKNHCKFHLDLEVYAWKNSLNVVFQYLIFVKHHLHVLQSKSFNLTLLFKITSHLRTDWKIFITSLIAFLLSYAVTSHVVPYLSNKLELEILFSVLLQFFFLYLLPHFTVRYRRGTECY